MSLSNHSTIVADLGASFLRVGAATDKSPRISAPVGQNTEKILIDLFSAISIIQNDKDAKYTRLVVGAPGLLNSRGMIEKSLHTPLSGTPLLDKLKEQFSVDFAEIFVANDANLHALGASKQLQFPESHFHISCGTGVGGGLTIGGKLYIGSSGFSGEVGHIRGGNTLGCCPCGRVDCVDLALAGVYLERDLGPTWWIGASPIAQRRLKVAATSLVTAIETIDSLFDPALISLSGHITNHPSIKDLAAQDLSTTLLLKLRWLGPTNWDLARSGALLLDK